MFTSFIDDEERINAMSAYSAAQFAGMMEEGELVAWVAAATSGEVVACGALSFYYLTSKPFNIEGKYGYISSMYTAEEHRRQGLARRILQEILNYAKDTGLRDLKLHASEVGEPLYSAEGFVALNEMGLVLD
tara:strand:- start:57 stop:452 length:396 start_codon:yes stop_codon:yes gene_type:complete